MYGTPCLPHGLNVALLAEGVDRNKIALTDEHNIMSVALLAEGVDRNLFL